MPDRRYCDNCAYPLDEAYRADETTCGVCLGTEVDLCVDCVAADANGSDDASPEWLGFLPRWDGWIFGPTEQEAEPHFVRPGTACDGCGSGLGGDRFDYYAVPRPGSGLGTNLNAGRR